MSKLKVHIKILLIKHFNELVTNFLSVNFRVLCCLSFFNANWDRQTKKKEKVVYISNKKHLFVHLVILIMVDKNKKKKQTVSIKEDYCRNWFRCVPQFEETSQKQVTVSLSKVPEIWGYQITCQY